MRRSLNTDIRSLKRESVLQLRSQLRATTLSMRQLLQNPHLGQEQCRQMRAYTSHIAAYHKAQIERVAEEGSGAFSGASLEPGADVVHQDDPGQSLSSCRAESSVAFRTELMARFFLVLFEPQDAQA